MIFGIVELLVHDALEMTVWLLVLKNVSKWAIS